jgi:hypothetical protein
MRSGIYALLAVFLGVALIGFLPGELSNLAARPAGLPSPLKSTTEAGGTYTVPPTGLRGNVTEISPTKGPKGDNVTVTGNGFTIVTQFNDTSKNASVTSIDSLASQAASTAAKASTAASQAAKTLPRSSGFVIGEVQSLGTSPDPWADVKYYGLWAAGLIAALAIYLVAKRLS